MWIFTKHGFFSAVEHIENRNWIHVRARFRGDLDRLCKAAGVVPNVQETPKNDYPFRMNFERSVWAKIVADEAAGIDYVNFKDAVHDGTPRDKAYYRCWVALAEAEKPR